MEKLTWYLFVQFVLSAFSLAQSDSAMTFQGTDSVFQLIRLFVIPVIKENRVLLRWTSIRFEKAGFFIIERSSNGKDFEVIGVTRVRSEQNSFEFTDEQPTKIKNHYRVKMTLPDGVIVRSPVVTEGIGRGTLCKFYPNPVDDLLIVRTDYRVELQIMDPQNQIKIIQQLQPGVQLVDVSMLDKGMYIIRILQKGNSSFSTEKLIKN